MKKTIIIVLAVAALIAATIGILFITSENSSAKSLNNEDKAKITNEEKLQALKDKIIEQGYSNTEDAYKFAEYEGKEITCKEPSLFIRSHVEYDSEGNPYTLEEDPIFEIICLDELENSQNNLNNIVDKGIATSEGTTSIND